MISQAWFGALQVQGGANGIGITSWYDRAVPRRQYTSNPRAQGGTDVTRFYDARTFSIDGNVVVTDPSLLESTMDEIAAAIALQDAPILLVFQREGIAYMEQAYVIQGTEFNAPRDPHFGQYLGTWAVDLIAADPRVYSNAETNASYDPTTGGVTVGVEFKLEFPLKFLGASAAELTVTNAGGYSTPAVYTITGPAIDPEVKHVGLGKSIATSNLVMKAGDTLTIDTSTKTVKLNGVLRPDLLDARHTSWFDLPAGASAIRLLANGMSAGLTGLAVSFRSARV